MPHIQKDVAKALIPLIAINVLGLGVNTLCLVHVETSFYQVWIFIQVRYRKKKILCGKNNSERELSCGKIPFIVD